MHERLFPFQQEAVKWLSRRPKAILALEQGLGKTVVSAVDLEPPAVVFSTAAMKHGWKRELDAWRPELKTQVLSGQDRKIDWRCDAWILNYDIAHRVRVPKPRTLIVDECHKIKNPDARRTGAVLETAKRVDRVRYLSGTPMLSRPIELYCILKSVGAVSRKMGWKSFGRRFCRGWNTPWGTYDVSGASNLDELSEIVQPYMFRKTKASVLPDLPPKMFRIVEFEGLLDPRETGFIEYHRRNLRLPDDPVSFQAISDIRRMQAESKLPEAVRYVRNVLESGEGKVVVFAHHRSSVDGLDEGLKDFGTVQVKGGTGSRETHERVQAFQEDSGVRVFIGNIQSSGEAITLTRASHVVLVEPSWVPGEIQQAADRCHRIGQTSSVLVDMLTVQGSLDAKMLDVALRKQEVIDQVVQETQSGRLDGHMVASLLREIAQEVEKSSD